VTELAPEALRDEDFDVVVLQRPHELEHLARSGSGRRPGPRSPAIYVEHNAPAGPHRRHAPPGRDRDDLLLVHVTHFNALFWDAGIDGHARDRARHRRPGHRYSGRAAARRGRHQRGAPARRVTGTDLLDRFAAAAPVDLFGHGRRERRRAGIEDLPQDELHDEMARRRVYLHPIRWTSLGAVAARGDAPRACRWSPSGRTECTRPCRPRPRWCRRRSDVLADAAAGSSTIRTRHANGARRRGPSRWSA
jgi:hypothetical protein